MLLIQAKITKVEDHQTIQQKHEEYVRNLSSKHLKGAGEIILRHRYTLHGDP